MKMAGWFTVLSTGMLLGAGWADAAESLRPSGAPSSIHGVVVDAITRAPLADAWVTLGGDPVVGAIPAEIHIKTAADGSYRFEDVRPTSAGFYDMGVCEGIYFCSSTRLQLDQGEQKRVDFALERFSILTVRIVSADAPAQAIASAHIAVFQGEPAPSSLALWTRLRGTDSKGESGFGLSRHDPYTLTVAKPGFKARSLTRTLTQKAWAETLTVALEPAQPNPARGLAGTVTDWRGSADGVEVLFLGEQANGTRFLFYDSVQAGSFRIDGIPMEVAGGLLCVPGETVVIGSDGFTLDYRLNSRRPIPAGIRPAARDGKGKRARSVSRWGTWAGKGRSFDIQGRALGP
jgi:hypothetical protein